MNLYATDPASHVLKSFIDSDGEFHYPFFLEFLLGQLAAAIRAEDVWNLVERGSSNQHPGLTWMWMSQHPSI
jgi:hypothetical protein